MGASHVCLSKRVELVQSPRLRALMLHGKGGNGPKFRRQLQPLLHEFQGNIDFVFPTAPYRLDATASEDDAEEYAWWTLPPGVRSFEAKDYIGFERSIQYLENVWKEAGPFDLLWGHSQGAILLASILASPKACLLKDAKLCILNGCAWPKPFEGELLGLQDGQNVKVPKTLHVVGKADKV